MARQECMVGGKQWDLLHAQAASATGSHTNQSRMMGGGVSGGMVSAGACVGECMGLGRGHECVDGT
jgi:hypothetical protein